MRLVITGSLAMIALAGAITLMQPGTHPASHRAHPPAATSTPEERYRQPIAAMLNRLVGAEHYEISLHVTRNPYHSRSTIIGIDSEQASPVSERAYSESRANRTLEETVTNNQYPWSRVETRSHAGGVEQIHAAILINKNAPAPILATADAPAAIEQLVTDSLAGSDTGTIQVTVRILPFTE